MLCYRPRMCSRGLRIWLPRLLSSYQHDVPFETVDADSIAQWSMAGVSADWRGVLRGPETPESSLMFSATSPAVLSFGLGPENGTSAFVASFATEI